MTAPNVASQTPGRILSGDEWQQSQYAPQRVGQDDPTKPKGPGRVLTGDEWESSRRAPDVSALKFPAMPKLAASDASAAGAPRPGGVIPGQYDTRPSPEQQAGAAIRNVAGGFDYAAAGLPSEQALAAHAIAAVGRQAVAPAVENPALTAAMLNPVGAVVGTGMAAHTVAAYGWQKAHELAMSPEDRAKAQANPDRVSGEAAAVQAVMLGLGTLAGVHSVNKATDVSEGMVEAGAKGMAPYFESPKGAEVLGTAAAAHGMPETASPFPPATELDLAWRDGHANATQAPAPATPAAPTAAEPAPSAEPAKTGPGYRGAAPLYAKLSDDALSAQYRALVEQRTTEQPNATAPLWTPEREAAAVEAIENRRRPDGSLSAPDKRALDALQSAQGEEYYVGRHTPESAAAERRLAVVNRHIAAIEAEMQGRGLKPEEALQPPATGEGLTPVEGTGATKTRGLSLGVEQKAIAKDLTDYLGDLPEYRQINMAEQAAKSTDLLTRDPELARRVALGETKAPEGVIPEAVFKVVEQKALEEGDVATIRDLASSKLTEEATTMGQRIRALRDRDPESPVAAIQKIEDARGGRGSGQAIGEAVNELRSHVEQSGIVDEGAWVKFIDSLRC